MKKTFAIGISIVIFSASRLAAQGAAMPDYDFHSILNNLTPRPPISLADVKSLSQLTKGNQWKPTLELYKADTAIGLKMMEAGGIITAQGSTSTDAMMKSAMPNMGGLSPNDIKNMTPEQQKAFAAQMQANAMSAQGSAMLAQSSAMAAQNGAMLGGMPQGMPSGMPQGMPTATYGNPMLYKYIPKMINLSMEMDGLSTGLMRWVDSVEGTSKPKHDAIQAKDMQWMNAHPQSDGVSNGFSADEISARKQSCADHFQIEEDFLKTTNGHIDEYKQKLSLLLDSVVIIENNLDKCKDCNTDALTAQYRSMQKEAMQAIAVIMDETVDLVTKEDCWVPLPKQSEDLGDQNTPWNPKHF